jgi:hypothetical protein
VERVLAGIDQLRLRRRLDWLAQCRAALEVVAERAVRSEDQGDDPELCLAASNTAASTS